MITVEQYLEASTTITLCGSTKFFSAYATANRLLTLKGWTVLSCGHFGHSYHKAVVTETVDKCKALHFLKILNSDAVCLVDISKHLGKSTVLELEFAKKHGKTVLEFESTGLHTGDFKLVEFQPTEKSSLDEFFLTEPWLTFVKENPEYY